MAEYFIGLISGTSMDGIDAVLVDFSAPRPRISAALTYPFDPEQGRALDALRQDPDHFPVAALAQLDAQLAERFAAAALAVLAAAGIKPDQVRAIGSHGQTVLHRPQATPPHTLQIADPQRIAAITGIPTVADFRRADMAYGGQGAPLAPLIHQALLASADENRVVINLGGIANISVLPARGGLSGFDTGPANCFLDLWFRQHHSGRFDPDGSWAASGQADPEWLQALLDDAYFQMPPPKSTGIEYFNPRWLSERLPAWASERPADIQASLLALSTTSIQQVLNRLPAADFPHRVICCGGGVRNRALMQGLAAAMAPVPVVSATAFGLDPDHVEALLFAWLARERLAERTIATPAITGASHPVLAGAIFLPVAG
ncbi:MAG: anhydro-N-acetylmuramic acid kinase [Wenzhouxiangella sp.]